ncbi:MAG: ABC transporter ATP-binding protein, partial [Acetobacteraceae bacterium]
MRPLAGDGAAAVARGRPDRDHAPDLSGAAAGLAALADLPVRLFSAGQKRWLAIARLALGRAPLWLLDEPSNGLDAAAGEGLGRLIEAHRARGGMIIAASHLALPLG